MDRNSWGTLNMLLFLLINIHVLLGELSPTLTHPPEILDMTLSEQQDLGYLPFRDDFDKVRNTFGNFMYHW